MCRYAANNSNYINDENISYHDGIDNDLYLLTKSTGPHGKVKNHGMPAVLMDKIEKEWTYEFILEKLVVPGLCMIGICGNLLTLLILTRRLRDGIDSLEKAALVGIMMLAISDGIFCFITILSTYLSVHKLIFEEKTISLFFTMYSHYFQNIFIKLSTYITMIMAIFRYIAITHATSARHILNYKNTLLGILISTVMWILFLLPLLWTWELQSVKCKDKLYYLLSSGRFERSHLFAKAITICWAVLGFILPVIILGYCNIKLIISLNISLGKTLSWRNDTDVSIRNRQTAQKRINITLICIVACFIVLQSPSEIFHFYLELSPGRDESRIISVALVTCNVLQMINMSFNFLLYCIVNSYFRTTLRKCLPNKCQQDDVLYNKLLLRNTILLEKYERSQSSQSRQNLALDINSRTCILSTTGNSPTEGKCKETPGLDEGHLLQIPVAFEIKTAQDPIQTPHENE